MIPEESSVYGNYRFVVIRLQRSNYYQFWTVKINVFTVLSILLTV